MTRKRIAFLGGEVWTDGFAGPRRLDVLVEGERIADVAPAGALDVDGADVHDVSGKLVVPGFQDAHIHLGAGGADLLTCNLADLQSPDDVFAAIRTYAEANPALPWIVGGGWNRELFPYPEGPTRRQLDELVGPRPAYFAPFDRHGAWVSTAALDAAGIDATTVDPPGGVIRRDLDGGPTGMLEEEAVALVRAVMPVSSTEDRMAAILEAQRYLLPMGITSVQDALVGTGLGLADHHEAFCRLVDQGALRLRLTTALWWDQKRGLEQIPEVEARRRALEVAGPDRVVADTVKIMVDGADLLFMDADAIREATVALDRLGFACHYHSYGDGTTRWILDAIEAAVRENGPRGQASPHRAPVRRRRGRLRALRGARGDRERAGLLGRLLRAARASGPVDIDRPSGEARVPVRSPPGGARLAAGSDWPVTTPDPLVCARTATGRYADPHGRRERPRSTASTSMRCSPPTRPGRRT